MAKPVYFSVVVEWENILLAEDDRCLRMLDALDHQFAEYDEPGEVIVLCNPAVIAPGAIEEILRRRLTVLNGRDPELIRVEEAPEQRYFALKIEGARRANGDVLIFLDSDVIPEAGWLENMLRPFCENSAVNVVAGQTYLDADSFISRAFALGWIFPLRNPDNTLREGMGFYANNIAIRSSLFSRYPFPTMPEGTTRGACLLLAEQLREAGITIWQQNGARLSHPVPNGWRHISLRALAHGRDNVMLRSENMRHRFRGVWLNFRWCVHRVLINAQRLVRERRAVGMAVWEVPFAWLLMTGFHGFAMVAGVVTAVFPGYARRAWQI